MQTGKYLVGAMLLAMVSTSGADRLVIPGHYPSETVSVLPKRGSSMEQVLGDFGEPVRRIDPVGEPPITEWDYGDFRVYFEYRTVLHAVDLTTLIMPQ